MTDLKEEPLVENVFAQDVFATEAVSFSVLSRSNVSITLASSRWNSVECEFQKVIIGRLVLPIAGAQLLAIGLNDFLSKQGLDPSEAVKQGAAPQ